MIDKSILIADDHSLLRETVAHAFRKRGWNVEVASNGEEVLDCLKRVRNLDVIVLDMCIPASARETQPRMMVPGSSKPEQRFSLKLIADWGRKYNLIPKKGYTPIVVYTSAVSVEDCTRCLKAGAFHYLGKHDSNGNPTLDELMRLCEDVVDRDQEAESDLTNWFYEHFDVLVDQFSGKTIAVVEMSDPDHSGIGEAVIDGWKIFVADSFDSMRDRILAHGSLLWLAPDIISVPSIEELDALRSC